MSWVISNIRATFLAFVVIGAGLIFSLSGTTQIDRAQPGAPMMLVGSVVFLMMVFGLIILIRSRGNYSSETDGDIFYYLGFIYTLITLVATFTPLLLSAEKPSTQQVLGLFGLGLITTFIGLSGRIFFLQSGQTMDAAESAQRLSQSYLEASRNLDSVSVQMQRIALEISQNIEKTHRSFTELLESTAHDLARFKQAEIEEANNRILAITTHTAEQVGRSLEAIASGFQTRLEEFGSRLEGLKLPPADLGLRLSKSVDWLIQGTEKASQATDSFQAQLSVTTRVLEEAVPAVSAVTKALDGAASSSSATAKEFEFGTSALAKLRTEAEVATQAIATIPDAAFGLKHSVATISDTLSSASLSIEKVGTAFEAVTTSTNPVAPALILLSTEVQKSASRIADLVSSISDTEKLAKGMITSQQGVNREFAEQIVTIKTYHEAVAKVSQDLQRELIASEAAIRKVHENLIAATEQITAKIG